VGVYVGEDTAVFSSSLASLMDIIPDSAHANDMGGRAGCVCVGGLRLDSPPLHRLLLLLVFFFFSLGGAGMVWRAEARREITGMGSH